MAKKQLTTAQVAVIMAVLTLASKGFGFIRELVIANYYGAGMITDAYVMASQIPGTILASIMTSCGTAYMPIFSEKTEKEGNESANLFTARLMNFEFILSGVVIILGVLFANPIVHLFAPGYSPEQTALTAYYLRIAFFLLIGNVLISVFEPYLQYKGALVAPVVLGCFYSISIIVVAIISVHTDYHFLIFGVVIGYAIRGAALLFHGCRKGFEYKLDFALSGAVKEVFLLALPIFIGGSLSQINTFVDRMLASGFAEGSVSALSYGHIMSVFISSVSITIIVTIIYPKLNYAFSTDNLTKIGEITESAINLFALFCIPFTLGSMLYAPQIIQIVYERGAFAAVATDMTSTAFFYYSMSLLFGAISTLLTKVYYSMHDTKTTVYCGAISVLVNIILSVVLSKIIGLGGLALATSIAAAVNAFALYYSFKHKYSYIVLLRSKRKLVLVSIFSIIAVCVSYLFYSFVGNLIWMPRMVLLGLTVLIAILVYIIFLYISKFEELQLIKDLVKH